MPSRRLWIAGAACAALAACNTANSHIGDEDKAFGESVKYNSALQTINPAPVYPAAAAQPGANGDPLKRACADVAVTTPSPCVNNCSTGTIL